jgi:hypothetical protein
MASKRARVCPEGARGSGGLGQRISKVPAPREPGACREDPKAWHIVAPKADSRAKCSQCHGQIDPHFPRIRQGMAHSRVMHVDCARYKGRIEELKGWNELPEEAKRIAKASTDRGTQPSSVVSLVQSSAGASSSGPLWGVFCPGAESHVQSAALPWSQSMACTPLLAPSASLSPAAPDPRQPPPTQSPHPAAAVYRRMAHLSGPAGGDSLPPSATQPPSPPAPYPEAAAGAHWGDLGGPADGATGPSPVQLPSQPAPCPVADAGTHLGTPSGPADGANVPPPNAVPKRKGGTSADGARIDSEEFPPLPSTPKRAPTAVHVGSPGSSGGGGPWPPRPRGRGCVDPKALPCWGPRPGPVLPPSLPPSPPSRPRRPWQLPHGCGHPS